MPDLDIAVWTHMKGPWITRALTSIARYCHFSHTIIVICEPGSVGENMQRVLNRAKSRFVMFFEDDAELLDKYTVPALRDFLFEHDDFAAVATELTSDRKAAQRWADDHIDTPPEILEELRIERKVLPAVFMYDREKVPDLYIEDGYLCKKYMRDLDLFMQIVVTEYKLCKDKNLRMFHHGRGDSGIMPETRIKSFAQFKRKWGVNWPWKRKGDLAAPIFTSPEPIMRHENLD